MRVLRDQFMRLKQRVDDLIRELTGMPQPEPELVPVRVRVRSSGVDRS